MASHSGGTLVYECVCVCESEWVKMDAYLKALSAFECH